MTSNLILTCLVALAADSDCSRLSRIKPGSMLWRCQTDMNKMLVKQQH